MTDQPRTPFGGQPEPGQPGPYEPVLPPVRPQRATPSWSPQPAPAGGQATPTRPPAPGLDAASPYRPPAAAPDPTPVPPASPPGAAGSAASATTGGLPAVPPPVPRHAVPDPAGSDPVEPDAHRPRGRTLVPLLAVGVTLLLVLGLSVLPSARSEPRPVAVTGRRVVACAAGDSTTMTTTVRGNAAEAIRTRTLGAAETTDAGTSVDVAAVPGPMVLEAASGLGAVSQSATVSGVNRGLWAAPCQAPASELWFPGVVSSQQDRAALELVNIDQSQAVVDVTIYGRDGRVVVQGARGLTVPAGSSRTVYLEPLVILPDPLGLRVQVASGRVTATVRASGDAGSDWTSPATAAASTLVVAGVPGGEGARTLVVTNPSDRRATVSVEVLGSDSSFAPAGADTFEVNAESTVAVPLEGALAGEVVGLRLTSTQPIMAGVRVRSGDDVAVVPASGPATGEARVPAIAGSEVVVSNGGVVPAPVTLTTRDAAGAEVDSTRVEVGAGRSTRLPVTGDRTATVELTGGTVQAVVLVTRLGTQEGIAVVPLDGGGAAGVEVTPSRDVSLPR